MITQEQMVAVLMDKGYSREYAETITPFDVKKLNNPNPEFDLGFRYDCSICRRRFTTVQWRYHYHPCE